jgi:hypothetical protein
MKTKYIVFFLLGVAITSFLSCSKDKDGANGTTFNYVIKATWDIPADHIGEPPPEVTHLALTTPSGGNSTSENCSTPLSIGEEWGDYPEGMTVTATCESVLSHVTLTVEIWKNGTLWKSDTQLGGAYYTVVTVTGTL